MRITVVAVDGVVCVDNVCYAGIDMASLPSTLHAMQWYDTYGEEEHVDPETRRPYTTQIGNTAAYQDVLDQWQVKHNAPPPPPPLPEPGV